MASPMHWRKLGRIFAADARFPWMKHYAQVPTPILLSDRIRVFFTTRPDPEADGNFVSYTTFLDVSIDDPTHIIYVHDSPVMSLGDLGCFDQFGTMPCCVARDGSQLRLYYVGWARATGVPWQSAIGLAVSDDDGYSFTRLGRGPVVTRTLQEPFVHGSPFVLKVGNLQHLWYLSGTSWVENNGKVESIYKLMHATSVNGVDWDRDALQCVASLTEEECQARPAVIIVDGKAHMWFSYRQGVDFRNPERGYGIGYAWSDDLKNWHREDHLAGIAKAEHGWDSEMISYPSLLQLPDRLLMFYCGNQMGRDGFGVAESRLSAD